MLNPASKHPPVSKMLVDGGSAVDVPSGEVWRVTMFNISNIEITGGNNVSRQQFMSDGNRPPNMNAVLQAGSSVKANGQDCYLSGWDIGTALSGSYTVEPLTRMLNGQDITVPNGEIFALEVASISNTGIEINGVRNGFGSQSGTARVVLDSSDRIDAGTDDVFISGYRLIK
jgi:hypothetical protein